MHEKMTHAYQLVPPYAEQIRSGIEEPKGICSICWQADLPLYPNNAVAPHSKLRTGSTAQEARSTTAAACSGGGTRTANLATVRTRPPLTLPESRMLYFAARHVLNDPALSALLDEEQTEILDMAMCKVNDPVHAEEL